MANNLSNIYGIGKDTAVKFYASKSKQEALALVDTEPGAICFVSDEIGNYIILDGKVFGDSSTGVVTSVNGKTGAIILNISDIQVNDTKNLSDFFDSNGQLQTDKLTIIGESGSKVVITDNGITYTNATGKSYNYITTANISALIEQGLSDYYNKTETDSAIATAVTAAKQELESKLISVYKVKGSLNKYSDLAAITNPKEGWVYNILEKVTLEDGTFYPAGTNFVYLSNGTWDPLGGNIDLSDYATEGDVSVALNQGKNYTDEEVGKVNTKAEEAVRQSNSTQASLDITNNQVTKNTNNINNIINQLVWQ